MTEMTRTDAEAEELAVVIGRAHSEGDKSGYERGWRERGAADYKIATSLMWGGSRHGHGHGYVVHYSGNVAVHIQKLDTHPLPEQKQEDREKGLLEAVKGMADALRNAQSVRRCLCSQDPDDMVNGEMPVCDGCKALALFEAALAAHKKDGKVK